MQAASGAAERANVGLYPTSSYKFSTESVSAGTLKIG